ncbi:MAG: hypothetical protein ABF290_14385 [Thiogranum sp.]
MQMDISRLPVTPLQRSASAPVKTTRQTASAEAVQSVEPRKPRQAGRGSSERVIQGELLHREHTPYQSTRAFIDERKLDQAQPAGRQQVESFNQARAAISRYLNNTRPDDGAELSQGRSVNFFV